MGSMADVVIRINNAITHHHSMTKDKKILLRIEASLTNHTFHPVIAAWGCKTYNQIADNIRPMPYHTQQVIEQSHHRLRRQKFSTYHYQLVQLIPISQIMSVTTLWLIHLEIRVAFWNNLKRTNKMPISLTRKRQIRRWLSRQMILSKKVASTIITKGRSKSKISVVVLP